MEFYLNNIGTSELIEMLAYYTEKFTHLYRQYKGINPSREYLQCKQTLEIIFKEIKQRRQKKKTNFRWWPDSHDGARMQSIFEKQMTLIEQFQETANKHLVNKFKELRRRERMQATTQI